MPLLPIVEDINQVEESLRGHYKQTDKGFMLDIQPANGYGLEDVSGLKSALSKERAKAQELEKKMSNFSNYDPSDLQDKLSRLEQLESLDPSKEADKIAEAKLKSLQDQMSTKHKKEIESLQGSSDKYKTQLKNLLIDDAAKNAILSAGGDERTITYMLPHVKSQLSLQETENGFMTQVVDGNGYPQVGDSNGNPMTINQLIENMKSQDLWSGAFPGRNKSGGGRSSDATGGTPSAGLKRSSMTTAETSAYVKKYGREAYFKLPK